jgi:hypothetical protein
MGGNNVLVRYVLAFGTAAHYFFDDRVDVI